MTVFELAMNILSRSCAAATLTGPDRDGKWTCELPVDVDAQEQATGFAVGTARDPSEAVIEADERRRTLLSRRKYEGT